MGHQVLNNYLETKSVCIGGPGNDRPGLFICPLVKKRRRRVERPCFEENNMIRILLVDDHAVVRAGYRQLLECAPEYTVVAEAASAAAGYRRFLECAPDVVITDLSLPGVGGIELLRRLRARQPDLRALAFSVHEESMF
eukprot:gene12417-15809_t